MKKSLCKVISVMLLFGIFVVSNTDSIIVLADDEAYYELKEDMDIVSEEDWEREPTGEYPVDIQSEEWEDMSYSEALAACDMPEQYVDTLTTEELVDYVVNYPFLMDILAFDSLEDGLNHLEETSTAFNELLSRSDSNDKLLEEYTEGSCDYESLEETNDMLETGYDEKIFLEAYFGLNYDELSDEQADKFVEEYSEQYDEQPESVQDYDTSVIFYDGVMESMDYIPEEAVPDNIREDVISENSANELSFTKEFKNPIKAGNGAMFYYGYHTIKGKKVYCYQYHSGDYTKATKKALNSNFGKLHPTFKKLRGATKKYNCHSYAWYTTKSTNKIWLDDPSPVFSNTKYYKKWKIPMATPGSGDRILFYSGTSLLHSAILTGSKKCKSKLGSYGVYQTTVNEMKSFYGASSTQTYVKK